MRWRLTRAGAGHALRRRFRRRGVQEHQWRRKLECGEHRAVRAHGSRAGARSCYPLHALMLGFGAPVCFKTTNGGGNWQAVNAGLTAPHIYALALDPVTPDTVYAGASGGVFKSINGGASWAAASTGLTATLVFALAVDPDTPETLYAGTNAGGFKSTNGGATWAPAGVGLPIDVVALAVHPDTPSTVFAATWGRGVLHDRG